MGSGLLSPELQEDPYPTFHALRSAAPVVRSPFGAWLVSRYADCAAAIRDPRLSSAVRSTVLYQSDRRDGRPRQLAGAPTVPFLLFLDPPRHTRLRRLVTAAFAPKAIERLRPRVVALVDGLLEAAEQRRTGHLDVVADLAYPLPVVLICELLGVAPADHTTFQTWSRDLAVGFDPDVLVSPEQQARVDAAAQAFVDYFATVVEHRRRRPVDDLISRLVTAHEGDDGLTQPELLATCLFLLLAGHETTVNLISNGTLALLQHPDQLTALRDDPGLIGQAVDELLRFDSPIQLVARVARDDYRLHDTVVPRGQHVMVLLGAANRDPDVFPGPDRLDITRDNAHRHLAFSGGPHHCLGAALARLEGEVAIAALVRRFPALVLDGRPTRRRGVTLRGLDRLPVSTGHRARR